MEVRVLSRAVDRSIIDELHGTDVGQVRDSLTLGRGRSILPPTVVCLSCIDKGLRQSWSRPTRSFVAAGKATTTRKSTKSAGKTKTRSAALKTKTSKPAAKRRKKVAKRGKTSLAKKPKAKSTKKSPRGKTVAKLSTKAKAVAKKSVPKSSRAARTRLPVAPPAPVSFQWGSETIELAAEGEAIPKTKLRKRALRVYQDLLLAKRRELVGDVLNLTEQALRGNTTGGGSTVPLHMADIGSDNWEQEFTLGLIETERALVREIDEALDRIEARTYGVCIATHRLIETARLRAKPWAKYCVEYARLRELGRVP